MRQEDLFREDSRKLFAVKFIDGFYHDCWQITDLPEIKADSERMEDNMRYLAILYNLYMLKKKVSVYISGREFIYYILAHNEAEAKAEMVDLHDAHSKKCPAYYRVTLAEGICTHKHVTDDQSKLEARTGYVTVGSDYFNFVTFVEVNDDLKTAIKRSLNYYIDNVQMRDTTEVSNDKS